MQFKQHDDTKYYTVTFQAWELGAIVKMVQLLEEWRREDTQKALNKLAEIPPSSLTSSPPTTN